MNGPERVGYRIVACRGDAGGWDFHLVNDGGFPLDEAVLYEVAYEWGDSGSSEAADVRVAGLAPGGHAQIWHDDGSGAELRMELALRLRRGGRTAQLRIEFPKLYRKKELPVVEGVGRPGWEETGEATWR